MVNIAINFALKFALMRNWGVMFASFYLLEITLEKMRIVVF
jgi:hypothetical protein